MLLALRTCRFPSFVQSCRLATRAEDQSGIDIVVYTDVGPLYLQIKAGSGKAGDGLKYRVKGIGLIREVLQLDREELWWRICKRLMELHDQHSQKIGYKDSIDE